MVEVLECEVCWAKETETNIYPYKNTHYCEQDLDRAIVEGWHNEVRSM